MAKEIERRFLVDVSKLPTSDSRIPIVSNSIVQGYLSKPGDTLVSRVRVVARKYGFFTVKYGKDDEFEYSIPVEDAQFMLSKLSPLITKTRYEYIIGPQLLTAEVDFFANDLYGIVLGEVELPSWDFEFQLPEYFSHEITGIKELSNIGMAFNPTLAQETVARLKAGTYFKLPPHQG